MSSDRPIITSTGNARVVEARKLDQRKHRQQQGRFLVEGLQLIHMALDAGLRPLEVFFCRALFAGPEAPALMERFHQIGTTLQPVSVNVMHALSDRDTPQGLIAAFALYDMPLESLTLDGSELVLVLDRLQDPGNLGTLLRTADAVGAAAVIVVGPATDPFDPRTVRASMGSLFNLPVVMTDDVPGLFEWLRACRLRIIGADARRGLDWTRCEWRGGAALLLGNEARGLSDDLAAGVEAWAALPIIGQADSLNVAVAGGVLMYTWVQHNRLRAAARSDG
jgi:TrmH family RNA methyltransferase